MFDRRRASFIVAGLVSWVCFMPPATAHKVKTDAGVGATFHIEPDHNPRAGEAARAWFALTRPGGEPISLEQCHCQLAVYDRSSNSDSPVLTPPLKAISAEQYQNLPGAEIVFPQAGIYELEIGGTPKGEADFQPFSLTYTVTVAPPTAPVATAEVETPVTDVATPTETLPNGGSRWWVAAMGAGIALGAGAFWMVRPGGKSKEEPRS